MAATTATPISGEVTNPPPSTGAPPATPASEKRGRGRPRKDPSATPVTPKAKETPAKDDVEKPKKSVGRPAKPKDPLAEAIAKAGEGFPRGRGRPAKKAKADEPEKAKATPESGVKRGRGRPKKEKAGDEVEG